MPDPRAVVSFEGLDAGFATVSIDNATITYDATKAGGSSQVGLAVMVAAASTVALTQDASNVFGKLINVEYDGKATVQFEGFMSLPGGLAAALTYGKKIVGATGAAAARGYVREVNTAVAAELGVMAGKIVDASDTTNVYVDL